MKKNIQTFLVVMLLSGLVLAACSGGNNGGNGATTEEIPVVVNDFNVIAEGRVIPSQYVNLTFATGGMVAEVLVEEGQAVSEGDVIARLENEGLASALAGAELELLQAQQAYDDLFENLDLLTAQAAQALAAAQDAVRDAERKVNNLTWGAGQVNIDAAQASVVLLRDRLETEQDNFEKYADRPEDNLTRASFQSRLAAAQLAYEDAVRVLNNLTGAANDVDMSMAEADLAVAQAQLAIAERDYGLWQNGPHPDDLASAEARLKAAQAAYDAALAAFENSVLTAPFDGAAVLVDMKAGEMIGAGQVAAVVADISQWVVETDNLTEIEVVRVDEGQAVIVVPDALPDMELSGTVESIGDLFEEKRGDITYTATILLDEDGADLRWGMTVVVNFQE